MSNMSRYKQNVRAGYTVVEVLVVVVIIAVLIASGWGVGRAYFAYLERARDAERAADTAAIAREFERYYRTNAAISGPSYPTTVQVTSSLSTLLDGANNDIVKVPGQSSVSLIAATSATPQLPMAGAYIYQPLTSGGALCTSAPCVRFNLYYRSERFNEVVVVESVRQQ